MQLLLLDKDFNTLGPINIYTSLIWTRRYYSPGTFELHMDPGYYTLVNQAKFLYRNDRTELGVIYDQHFTQDEEGKQELYIKGYFAERLLNDRVIQVTRKYSGQIESISRSFIQDYVISPTVSGRAISFIRLGEESGITGNSVSSQNTGDELGDLLYEIEKTQEMSHRLRFDYQNNILYFEVWKGKDRTENQRENSWALFSNDFHNVKTMEYNKDASEAKNYIYVAGEGTGENRTVIEIDLRTDSNEERRELYVDARDLQSSDDPSGLDPAEDLDV